VVSVVNMNSTTKAWVVLKADGSPLCHVATEALAIFEDQVVAHRVSKSMTGSIVSECTVTYQSDVKNLKTF
jgi:hypothetical protein